MELSARNQLGGTIRSVRTGGLMAEVTVEIDPTEITAMITETSSNRLKLKDGDRVTVIIKSTEVMTAKG